MQGGTSIFSVTNDSLVQQGGIILNGGWREKAAKHAVFATACRNCFYGEVKHFNALPNFICMFSRMVVDDF